MVRVDSRRATHRDTGRPSPREVGVTALIVGTISALFLIVANAHGAFGAARNDDWTYYHVAFAFARNQHFSTDGWIETMLIGHTILAWPVVVVFGDSIRALQVLEVVVGAVGIVCCYPLLRRLLSPTAALLACVTLLIGPVFASLAVSYMTDTTAFTAQLVTLLLGVKAFESTSPSGRTSWLTAAAITGFVAVSIREDSIVAFAAVVIVAAARYWRDREARATLVRIGGVFAVAMVALVLWRRSLPVNVAPDVSIHLGRSDIVRLVRSATTIGLFVSPVVLTLSPLRVLNRAWTAHRTLTVAGVAFGVVCAIGGGRHLLGNYVEPDGSYADLIKLHTTPHVIPGSLYTLAVLLGDYALVMGLLVCVPACAIAIRTLRARTARRSIVDGFRALPALALVAAFLAMTAFVHVIVLSVTTQHFYDRYLITLVPFVAALLLLAAAHFDLQWPRPTIATALALILFASVGFTYIDASATLDGARWRAGERLAAAGFKPSTIDSYEWFAFHQQDDVRRNLPAPDFATSLFTPRTVCVTVVVDGTEQGARITAEGHTIEFRQDISTLLGRHVFLSAVDGPTQCRVGG